jgi:hypothetical protein
VKKMMMEMEEDEEEPDEDDDENPQTVNVGEFNSHVYEKFIELWEKYECISVVVLGDGSIKVVIDNGSNWMDVFVRPKKKHNSRKKNGMTYSYFDHSPDTISPATHEEIRYGCVMLPLLNGRSRIAIDRCYTIIRSDWRVWDGCEFNYIPLI